MARYLPRLVPVFVFLAFLAGCNNAPPPPEKFPELSWTHLPPIKLDVVRLEVIKAYVPSDQPPHVETLAPRTLIDSADRWARDRIRPVGSSGWVSFIITDASLLEVPLLVKKGINYAFTNQVAKRYDAHVAVRLEIHNERGYMDGQVSAEASASREVSQEASEREIRETQYLVVQDAMLRLNTALETNTYSHLQRFIQP